MFQPPEHVRKLSLRLSQVLDEIGVNEDLVMRRRKAWMLAEKIENIIFQILDVGGSVFLFGSRTEGSTTQGLKSDLDLLYCNCIIRVIADLSEWAPYSEQYLMVQDDTVSNGYCLLQAVRSDAPLPEQNIKNEHISRDHSGRLIFRHSMCLALLREGRTRHGPATATAALPGGHDVDGVVALHCSTWPKEADVWLQRQNVSGWPTEDMKRYLAKYGCFLVPVDSKTSVYKDLEWRISTSLAERHLIWSLNITQLRCYILLKMIIKTFLKPKCGEAISTFICKNILFLCIACSRVSCEWNEDNLVKWLNQCLRSLLNCILTEHCPHFIIPHNNLLAGKLSAEVKHKLTNVISKLTENIEQSLLAIQIDDLGNRLTVKSGGISEVHFMSKYEIAFNVAGENILYIGSTLHRKIMRDLKDLCTDFDSVYKILTHKVSKLCQINSVGDRLVQVGISLGMPVYCTYVGSVKASADINKFRFISHEALGWFSSGLNSDICSGTLKLASALYCAGNLCRCETILATLKLKLSQTIVLSLCCCYRQTKACFEEFLKLCLKKNEDAIKHNMAFCVKFLPCEVNCIPDKLKYEMFRSTEKDRPFRDELDFWMDWAVVDSLPYLHFLQYKVYSQLHRPADQKQALDNLIRIIVTEPNLGHRETALNLLGQCMEQENRHEEALRCYIRSLNVRARNNVAKWHVCRLLARQFCLF